MASLSVDATYDRIHQVAATIRVIPDFPKPGILFQDITKLLLDPKALKDTMGDLFVESDGFFFVVKEVSLFDQGDDGKQQIIQFEHVASQFLFNQNSGVVLELVRFSLGARSIVAMDMAAKTDNEESIGLKLASPESVYSVIYED